MLFMAACQPSEPPLPTLVPVFTEEIAPTIEPSPTIILTPRPTQAVSIGSSITSLEQMAYLRIIHAAQDIPTVDVYVETTLFGPNISAGQIMGKTPILAGSYAVRFMARGASPDEVALTQTGITLEPDQSVVVLFAGTADAPTTRTYTEPTASLRAGESRVTFINAVPQGAGVTVWKDDLEATPPLGFGQQSDALIVSSGETILSFRSGEQTRASQNANLLERTAYTYVLTGTPGSSSIIGFNERITGKPSIRVINVSPEARAVDVYMDETPLVTNAAFAQTSQRQTIEAGTHLISVYPTGDNTTALLENQQINANADETISLIIMGKSDNLRLLTHRENLARTPISTARVSFVNALESVGFAAIGQNNALRDDVFEISYGQGSSVVEFPTGESSLFWQRVERGTPVDIVETAQNVSLEAGQSYLYVLTGNSEAPAIFSEEVGIDENSIAVVAGVEALPTSTVDPGVYIRFVNAMYEEPNIDILLNGLPVVTALEYAQASEMTVMPAGQYTITVQTSDNFRPVLVTTFIPPPPGYYTILFSGAMTHTQMQMVTDTDLSIADTTTPYVRLINLSSSERAEFGLVSTAPTESKTSAETPSARIADLPPVPEDIRTVIEGVSGANVSEQQRGPVTLRDLLVTYSQANRVAKRVHSVALSPGVHYDIVAFQVGGSSNIQVFILPYPQR